MFPLFLALLSAFLFGFSTPLSKGLLGHFEPQVLAGLLNLGAALGAGVLLGFACLCWGLDNNLTALIDGLTPMQSTFWKGLVAGIVNLTLGIFLSGLPQQSVPMYAGALGVGAIAYGASIILYITAAQRLGATRSQSAFAAAPFFGLAASALWLREPITPYQAAAAALQIAGLVPARGRGQAHAKYAICPIQPMPSWMGGGGTRYRNVFSIRDMSAFTCT